MSTSSPALGRSSADFAEGASGFSRGTYAHTREADRAGFNMLTTSSATSFAGAWRRATSGYHRRPVRSRPFHHPQVDGPWKRRRGPLPSTGSFGRP